MLGTMDGGAADCQFWHRNLWIKMKTRGMTKTTEMSDSKSDSDVEYIPDIFDEGVSSTASEDDVNSDASNNSDKKRSVLSKKANRKRRLRIPKIEGRTYRPAAYQTRCSPRNLKDICHLLNTTQKEAVMQMGFALVLDYTCTQLDRVLCKELVEAFDIKQYGIHVKGIRISVNVDDVESIFGIPTSGLPVSQEMSQEDEAKIEDVKGLSNSQLRSIIASENADDKFKRAFLLYILSKFFCPTTLDAPSPRLYPTIVDIDNSSQYDWCGLVLEWLVNEIKRYKKKRYSRQSIGGCTFFLMILYFHRRPLGRFATTEEHPVATAWDDKKVSESMRLERKDQEGLLHNLVDQYDPAWVCNILKHEVSKDMFRCFFSMLKTFDEELLNGKYNLNPLSTEGGPRREKKSGRSAHACRSPKGPPVVEQDDFLGEDLQPRRTKDLQNELMKDKLYQYCTSGPTTANDLEVVSWDMSYLKHSEVRDMRPYGWVNDQLVDFACMVFNLDEEKSGLTARWCINPNFAAICAGEFERCRRA